MIWQNLQYRAVFNGRRFVAISHFEHIGPQRIDAKILKTIVSAQKIQVISAPVSVVIVTREDGGDIGDIYKSHSRRVFEEKGKEITTLDNGPVATSRITQTAILRLT